MTRAIESKRTTLIDGKGHILGRLATTVAKQLLYGNRVVVVRCEEINQTGSLIRNRLKFQCFLNKFHRSNPKKGPFHHRSPSKMFMRVVRGMLPRVTKRGKAAFARLRAFEGIPPQYQRRKRFVCPTALRICRLSPDRKFTTLGAIANLVGWKYASTVKELEGKRKERSNEYYRRKQATLKLLAAARKQVAGGK